MTDSPKFSPSVLRSHMVLQPASAGLTVYGRQACGAYTRAPTGGGSSGRQFFAPSRKRILVASGSIHDPL